MKLLDPYHISRDELISSIVDSDVIDKEGNIAIIGSNYLLFGAGDSLDDNCSSCVPYEGLQEPTNTYNLAFNIALEVSSLLRKKNINAVPIIFPSDLPKGVSREELDNFRENYKYPKSFIEILEQYSYKESNIIKIPKPTRPDRSFQRMFESRKIYDDKTLFVLESQYLRRANSFLRRIVSGSVPIPTNCEIISKDSDGNKIFYLIDNSDKHVFYEIPIGLSNSEGLYTPYCQLIFGRFLRELSISGVTQVISIFDENETPCVDQATTCAFMYGLDMKAVTVMNIRDVNNNKVEIINNSIYKKEMFHSYF